MAVLRWSGRLQDGVNMFSFWGSQFMTLYIFDYFQETIQNESGSGQVS